MSIENVFNDPTKVAKIKTLEKAFNPIVQGLRDLDIADDEGDLTTDVITKHLIKVYAKRRKNIGESINENADITSHKLTRTRKPKEEATSEVTPEVNAATTPAPDVAPKTTGKKKPVGADMM